MSRLTSRRCARWTSAAVTLLVVGLSAPAATVWGRDGNPTLLAPLPGNAVSFANDVNSRGDAVGASVRPGPPTATVWDRDGNPTALAPLAGNIESLASDVNSRGDVVGASNGPDPMPIATLWG